MEVEFRLPVPAFEDYTWAYDNEHNPASHPPLTLWMPGMEGPGKEAVPSGLKINGYSYWRVGAMPPFATAARGGEGGLSPLQSWRTRWLPRLEKLLDSLATFDPAEVAPGTWAETLNAQQREAGRVMAGVHANPLHGAWQAAERFREAYLAHFGAHRAEDSLAILQGVDNASASRAIELWELARGTAEGKDFHAGLDRFLERWGQTIDQGIQDRPSWAEDPAPVLAAVAAQAGLAEGQGPRARHQATAARREELEQELRQAADTSPGAARALELLPSAQEYVLVLEDHNVLCDQRLGAASRMRWLAVGRFLVDEGVVDEPGHVFYYDYTELLEVLEGGPVLPPAEIASRRQRQAAWRSATPPPFLGRPPEPSPVRREPLSPPSSVVARGRGASSGTYRGRARVVRSLEEAWALQPGEVLVCAVTSPSWTPLFGIAGAVVTGAGGVLSHAAVVAREFGIPAVVGCGQTLALIPDGAEVEVDGAAGTVWVVG